MDHDAQKSTSSPQPSEAEAVDAYLYLRLARRMYVWLLWAVFAGAIASIAPRLALTQGGFSIATAMIWTQVLLQVIFVGLAVAAGLGMSIVARRESWQLVVQLAAFACAGATLVGLHIVQMKSGVLLGGCLGSGITIGMAILPCLPLWISLQRDAAERLARFGCRPAFLGVRRRDLLNIMRQSPPIARHERVNEMGLQARRLVTGTTQKAGVVSKALPRQRRLNAQKSPEPNPLITFLRWMDKGNRKSEEAKTQQRIEDDIKRQEMKDAKDWERLGQRQEKKRREQEEWARRNAVIHMSRAQKEDKARLKRAEKEKRQQQRAQDQYERALKKQVLQDPIGSQMKLLELEQKQQELLREPLKNAEAQLRIEKLALEIEALRRGLGR